MKQSMAAGEFKAKCLQVLDDVQQSRKPMIVTKRGKPVVQIIPIPEEAPPSGFGYLKGTIEITGDIIGPLDERWDADE